MKKKPLHLEWLDRARSNLERARVERKSRYIKYEDMCFDCQQCVEKVLKSLLVFEKIEFEWTHNIGALIKNLETKGIVVPEIVKKSASLSVYAVRTRYPGEEEPVSRKEFIEARYLAEMVFKWAKGKLKKARMY